MNPRFQATVEKGQLVLKNPKDYQIYLCGLESKKVSISIKKWYKQRTNQENRYYHGVVVKLISEYTGYTTEETHEALKFKFLRVPSKGRNIDAFDTVKSTTELSTVEFEQFMTDIRQWGSTRLDLWIPEPNEVEWDFNK